MLYGKFRILIKERLVNKSSNYRWIFYITSITGLMTMIACIAQQQIVLGIAVACGTASAISLVMFVDDMEKQKGGRMFVVVSAVFALTQAAEAALCGWIVYNEGHFEPFFIVFGVATGVYALSSLAGLTMVYVWLKDRWMQKNYLRDNSK